MKYRLFRTAAADDRLGTLERQNAAMLEQLQQISAQLTTLTRHQSQLRAVLERDTELERHLAKLDGVLAKVGIGPHIERAVARADLHTDPFPYAVVDDVLPGDLYGALLRGLPPAELFADRPANKQQLAVPFRLAPAYSQRVWRYLTATAIPEHVLPAVLEKFRDAVDAWLRLNWPSVDPASVQFHSSDGRILRRGRGYRIPPHRDPKWGFLTCILYLAAPSDSESWGTQIYAVDQDEEARGAAPHWIDPARCRQVADVKFTANRMLVFLNSVGAHGAFIPEDAQPENLERYIFQFRLAPTVESMTLLKSTLDDDRRPMWAGKAGDY